MGTVKDPFTADETIDLLKRFDEEDGDEPWLTVCSFLNPHDDRVFRPRRAAAGAALPAFGGPSRRACPDPRGGPIDQARLSGGL